MPENRPNILLIITDQHSKHHLGAYGDPLTRTPNLDALAAEGLRFDDAYCPAPLCVPSRMSMLSSLTPSHARVLNNNNILASDIPTWATALTVAGYDTALIGRMHFQGPDQRHGFAERPYGEFSAGYPGMTRKGGPGFTVFPGSTTGQCREAAEIAGRGIGMYQWADERVTEHACSWLMNRESEQPFAAVVGYLLPHCPFIGESELYDYYYDRVDIPEIEENQPALVTRFRRNRDILRALPEERVRVVRAAYFAMCEAIDRMIGRVLDALERTGRAENTLVVYTSDHGELAGEHGCFWKSNFYEGSVGVPFIARYPGAIPAGSSTTGVMNLLDLGPTLRELAGADQLADEDGRSFVELLEHPGRTDTFDTTTAEFVDRRSESGSLPLRMIRKGRYKYARGFDAENLPPLLFDLEEDPGEIHDLGTDEEHRSIREKLDAELCSGWDGDRAVELADAGARGFAAMSAWAQAVNPDAPCAEYVPPPQFEENAERR